MDAHTATMGLFLFSVFGSNHNIITRRDLYNDHSLALSVSLVPQAFELASTRAPTAHQQN